MAASAQDVPALLAAARAGSREALGQVIEVFRPYLLLVARQELDPAFQGKGSPSDLVQETFLEAHRDFDRFHGTTSEELLAWLRQLLLHNVADFTRRYRDTAKRGAGREVPLEAGSSSSPGPEPCADTPSPSQEAIANEEAERFAGALKQLPDDYRQVILLRYQEQHSFEEIGQLLQRTPNAARMLWLRAVERLKKELGISDE
jgi:RNA polymerase sigma-70 factor (ECF subfamily)